MNRFKIVICMAVVFSLLAAGCGTAGSSSAQAGAGGTSAAAAAEGVKYLSIGICEPMTGGMASSGEYSVRGATLAVDEINAKGGVTVGGETYQFKLVIQDSEGKTDVTINAYNKLIGDDKVIAIIGTNTSGTSMAGGPVATEAQVPAITPIGTNPELTTVGGEYVFRTCMTDDYQGKLCAQTAWELLGHKKGAVLYNNADDFSTGVMDLFVESFEGYGGEVMTVSYAGADVKDFRAQLTQIQEYGAEFIFIPAQPNEIPLIIQQVRGMGLDCDVIGDSSWEVDTIPELAGNDVVEDCYFLTMFSPDSDDPLVVSYVEAYNKVYDGLPNSISIMNYCAVFIIAQALEDCGTVTDAPAFRDAIANIDIDLPIGHFTYNEKRDPVDPPGHIMQYKDGVPVYVTTLK